MQNKIIRGRDNPITVIFSFSGPFAATGLNGFTRIDVLLENETYSSTGDKINILDNNRLEIAIGDATNVAPGRYMLEIVGFSATYDDGYVLSGKCNPVLPVVEVC